MASIIIECKNKAPVGEFQQDAGIFTTTIQEKILLEEGDTIMMKKAFIDTNAAVTQMISITDEQTVTMKHIHYQNNFQQLYGYRTGTGRSTMRGVKLSQSDNWPEYADPEVAAFGDWFANEYIMFYENSTTSDANLFQMGFGTAFADGNLYLDCTENAVDLHDYHFKPWVLLPNDATKAWGGFTLQVNYTDTHGVEQVFSKAIPAFPVNTTKGFTVTLPFYFNQVDPLVRKVFVTAQPGNFDMIQMTPPNSPGIPTPWADGINVYKNTTWASAAGGAAFVSAVFPTGTFFSQDLAGKGQAFAPMVYETTFKIKPGNYVPADLAEEINRGIAAVGPNITSKDLVDNPMLTSLPISTNNTWVNPVRTDISGAWGRWSDKYMVMSLDFRYRYGKGGAGAGGDNQDQWGVWDSGVSGQFNMGLYTEGPNGNPDCAFSNSAPSLLGATWSGTSQCAMLFNQDTNEFYWDYTHLPYYSGGDEVVGYSETYDNLPFGYINDHPKPWEEKTVKPVRSAGGVLFTELSSVDSKGHPTRFTTDKSDNNCMLVDYEFVPNKPADYTWDIIGTQAMYADRQGVFKPAFLKSASMPDNVPVIGTHMTAGFQSMSTAVLITKDAKPGNLSWLASGPGFTAQPGWGNNMPPDLTTQFTKTNGKTTPVVGIGGVAAQNSVFAFGYYVIEVDSKFKTEFVTANANRHSAMAIVSRYYEKETYTSATEDDSMIYTHHGPPTLLSSFNIRILDSNNQLASNLGVDSTIFLNVIKAPKIEAKA